MPDIKQRAHKKRPYSKITRNEYLSIHNWLRTNYGRATRCESPSCLGKSKLYQRALKKGHEYTRDIKSFIQLCRSCHATYDLTEEGKKRIGKAAKARKVSQETRALKYKPVIQMSMDGKEIARFPSMEQAELCSGISRSSISSNCVGRQKRTKNMKNYKIYYKWKYDK